MRRKIGVIGAGYAGLATACYLAKEGNDVSVFEKNDSIGGRSRKFEEDGFTFDMGPSWYWMPDVFDTFFNDFGKRTSDYYTLERLSPSYRVYYGVEDAIDLPADLDEMYTLFESIEKGSAEKLRRFLMDAKYKYDVGINEFVQKPSLSVLEFASFKVLKGALKLNLFKSFSKFVRQYFSHPRLIQVLEFPVLFLGAKPENIPALYSLMNYADIVGGTWYPQGGMFKVIEAMESLALELGVEIHLNSPVEQIEIEQGFAKELLVNGERQSFDAVVAAADYHFVEQNLIPEKFRKYDSKYWDSRVMAPSCLLFYLGIDKKLDNLLHHNLFFDRDFSQHAVEIYDTIEWPSDPLFYVCAPSVTDDTVAPEGKENVFLLMPIAPGLQDDEDTREKYYHLLMDRLEAITNQEIRSSVIYKKSYALKDFVMDYNAFKGNAYGLANTLKQTAILKPTMHNPKIKNLFFAGQLTVPGPGVPPSLISGKVAAIETIKYLNK